MDVHVESIIHGLIIFIYASCVLLEWTLSKFDLIINKFVGLQCLC